MVFPSVGQYLRIPGLPGLYAALRIRELELNCVAERIRQLIWQCLSLGFSIFEIHLAEIGGLFGVHSGLQVGLFREVAPARMAVFCALARLEMLHFELGVVPALYNSDDSPGLIGPDVVADDGKRSFGFVAGQRHPNGSSFRDILTMIGTACPHVG